jgi:hypothetical protein
MPYWKLEIPSIDRHKSVATQSNTKRRKSDRKFSATSQKNAIDSKTSLPKKTFSWRKFSSGKQKNSVEMINQFFDREKAKIVEI